ncbi:GFA family protein [Novosphingobium beihaiensis]|uniref:GFA family protein n=1 Tax=Novosphingobium beihaiensis TaxID=2930389 RepID=A0ABT0BS94_9SPHN|nr:GFA family protein [Novosphingobium beihaiensis]MCJ2187930.1 GFA family protein [Novosphingobium beihaiensis]
MPETVHEGGCGCGALRYRVHGEPIFVNNCHCTLCQHQTGSTSVVNAFYESERIEIVSGETREDEVKSGSGGRHVICRCAACGTAVMSHYDPIGKRGAGLRAGTFDDPSWIRPDAIIFVSEKMPWVTLPEGIPAFETTYKFSDVLPPERMARLMALV